MTKNEAKEVVIGFGIALLILNLLLGSLFFWFVFVPGWAK
jgi:hypothetical protein